MTGHELTGMVARPRFWGGSLFLLIGLVAFAPSAIRQIANAGILDQDSVAMELLLIALLAWIAVGLVRTRVILVAAFATSVAASLALVLLAF